MTRLVVTSDTHFRFDNKLIPDGDVFIHCGDFMYSGHPDEWPAVLESFAALTHKTKIVIPGNHDFHIQNYLAIAKSQLRRQAKVKLLDPDNPVIKLGGKLVFAVPFVTGLPRWAFNQSEPGMGNYLKGWNLQPDIVISHGPMYNMLDAVNPNADTAARRNHVGSWELSYWYHQLEKKPEYFFHGHIHESYGEECKWGTHFVNAAMCDRKYEQVNPAIVIDI